MKTFAPGKLILSGEHSVVYGKPALAMAVNRHAIAHVTPTHVMGGNVAHLSFKLGNSTHDIDFIELQELSSAIEERYERFINGEYKINQVLQKPIELLQFACALLFKHSGVTPTDGLQILLNSDIPMGCGMGSSAAAILSVLHAMVNYLKIDLTADDMFRLGLQAENMQHGYSSGLDLKVSLNGGCLYFNGDQASARPMPRMENFYLVNTGKPASTTGECVEFVANKFKESSIWDDFANITMQIDNALQSRSYGEIKRLINSNHRLLMAIGVVPQVVAGFIDRIKEQGGAAKICGAGAVHGKQAGIVLVMTDDGPGLKLLCEDCGYGFIPVSGEKKGIYVN